MNIVTQSQLKRVTGSADPARQCDILRLHGIVPIIRDDGRLTVFEEVLIQAQLVQYATNEPNWSAMDGATTTQT